MKRRLATLFALIACIGAPKASTQDGVDDAVRDYAGDWRGTLGGADPGLPLIVHVDPESEPAVTLDSPTQGALGLAAEHADEGWVQDGALVASWPDLGASYTGRLSEDGASIEGTFSQGGREFALDLERADGDGPAARPQEPVRPLPYREEAVRIDVPGTGVTLAGTLTRPKGDGPFPGVVLLSGSGAQDRDEALLGHRPFLVLSDRLTRAGIAVLRTDDRGVGESGGTFEGATSRDFAADAAAALGFLKAREDTGAVGFVGHSEGALVAPLAIVENEADADFVVALGGPFVPMRDVIARQAEDRMRLLGVAPPDRESNMIIQNRILDAATGEGDEEAVCAAVDRATADLSDGVQQESRAFCGPWFRTIFRLDPPALHRAADVPTLALFGALDTQVAAEPGAAAARALPSVEVRVVEGANHLFQSARTGAVAEYAALEETMREDVMATVADWVAARR